MADDNRDRRNVYEPMWKPIKTFGIPRDYFYILAVVTPIVWGLSRNILVSFLLFAGLYGYGYFKSQKDPEFMLVHLVRVLKLKRKVVKHKGKPGSVYIV